MFNDTVPLIERDLALQALQSALGSARQGAGRAALVCGEAGIGKTSLVARFAAEQPDLRVLWGGCEALYSPRPLGPLYDMAGALDPGVRALLGPQGHRGELFAAVLAELQQSDRPTMLVFEDVHWADTATLDLIKFLARRIQRVHALMVLTYRDDELGEQHPLHSLLGDLPANAAVRVPLLPLSESAVAELARQSSRVPDGLHAVTGGNPFFLTEALRGDGLPATVRDAVVARAARQSAPVRELLDMVAIVPTRLDIRIADALLATRPEDVSAALASGLLSADARSYAYRHELARIAIEQALPAPKASALHAKMLAHLQDMCRTEQPDISMTRLVHHAARAGESAAVLNCAPQAAAEAASHGAHREAAELYATALAHSFSLAPLARAALLEQRAYQCYLTDQTEDAIDARLSALSIWRSAGDREQEGRALRWLSRLHWILARNAEAEAYADEAVQLLEGLPAGHELAWALSNRAQLHMLAGRTDDAIAWGTRAMALATQLGDTDVTVHAMTNLGTALYQAGREGGRAMLEQSLALALAHGQGEHVARAYANLASIAVLARDYPLAQHVFQEAAVYFAGHDLDVAGNYVLACQARLDLEQGRWESAETLAARLVAGHTVAPVARIPALTVLAVLQLRHGDPQADALLDEATALALKSGELQRLAPVAAARAEARWLRREASLAADGALLQVYESARRGENARVLGELSAWLRRLDIDHAEPRGVEPAYALQFAGQWRAAADAWAQLGCPYEQALALLDGDEAGMRSALAMFEQLGASAAAKRCREHLQEAGVRGVPRGPRAATAANHAGLTSRELQILGLLAQGMTNAEIAGRLVRSEKTVDHHVAAVLRKLDVRSRREAAAVADRLGLVS